MILQRYIDTYVGMYDFAVSGGAIGSYDLGIPVPVNCVPYLVGIRCITPPVGRAGATISWDIVNTSVAPPVTTVGQLKAATLLAGYGGAGNVVAGTSLAVGTNVFMFPFSFSIGMSIGVAPLTAGKLSIFVLSVGFDI